MDNPADKIYILFQLTLGYPGKLKAFKRIWNVYSSRISFYISKIIREDKDSADDCFQEVMLKIFQGLDSYKAEYPMKPWIYTIARNQSLDFMRRRFPEASEKSEMLPSPDFINPQNLLHRKEIFNAVETAIRKLPDDESQIDLRFYENMKISDIAEIMKMNVNTVKTKITGMKKILQNDLREWL